MIVTILLMLDIPVTLVVIYTIIQIVLSSEGFCFGHKTLRLIFNVEYILVGPSIYGTYSKINDWRVFGNVFL